MADCCPPAPCPERGCWLNAHLPGFWATWGSGPPGGASVAASKSGRQWGIGQPPNPSSHSPIPSPLPAPQPLSPQPISHFLCTPTPLSFFIPFLLPPPYPIPPALLPSLFSFRYPLLPSIHLPLAWPLLSPLSPTHSSSSPLPPKPVPALRGLDSSVPISATRGSLVSIAGCPRARTSETCSFCGGFTGSVIL